ncbi:MAG: hypothetical protein ACYDAG_00450 [Chloroflexota bacterium]
MRRLSIVLPFLLSLSLLFPPAALADGGSGPPGGGDLSFGSLVGQAVHAVKSGAGVVGTAIDQAQATVADKWSVYQDQRAGIPAACETNWCYDKKQHFWSLTDHARNLRQYSVPGPSWNPDSPSFARDATGNYAPYYPDAWDQAPPPDSSLPHEPATAPPGYVYSPPPPGPVQIQGPGSVDPLLANNLPMPPGMQYNPPYGAGPTPAQAKLDAQMQSNLVNDLQAQMASGGPKLVGHTMFLLNGIAGFGLMGGTVGPATAVPAWSPYQLQQGQISYVVSAGAAGQSATKIARVPQPHWWRDAAGHTGQVPPGWSGGHEGLMNALGGVVKDANGNSTIFNFVDMSSAYGEAGLNALDTAKLINMEAGLTLYASELDNPPPAGTIASCADPTNQNRPQCQQLIRDVAYTTAMDDGIHTVTQEEMGQLQSCKVVSGCQTTQTGGAVQVVARVVAIQTGGGPVSASVSQLIADGASVAQSSQFGRPCVNAIGQATGVMAGADGASCPSGEHAADGQWYLNKNPDGTFVLTFTAVSLTPVGSGGTCPPGSASCPLPVPQPRIGPSAGFLTGPPNICGIAAPSCNYTGGMDHHGVQVPPPPGVPVPVLPNGPGSGPTIDFQWGLAGQEGYKPYVVNGSNDATSPWKGIINHPVSFLAGQSSGVHADGRAQGFQPGQFPGINAGAKAGKGVEKWVPVGPPQWWFECHYTKDCAGQNRPTGVEAQHQWMMSSLLQQWSIGPSPEQTPAWYDMSKVLDERGYLVWVKMQYEHFTSVDNGTDVPNTCPPPAKAGTCGSHHVPNWQWKAPNVYTAQVQHAVMIRQVKTALVAAY